MMNRRMLEACAFAALTAFFALIGGLASAGLIPGGGPTKSDCYAELNVDGITNPSTRVQKNKTVLITDGDVGDTGPCGDNKCTVKVAVCINQKDPNLTDCTPPASLDKLNVKGAVNITVPQLLTGSACGAFVTGEISEKVKLNPDGTVKKAKLGKAKFKVTAKGPKGTKPRSDVDNVIIQCLPRTVACPASASGAFLE